MGSWLYALCPSKTKWDRERVEMGLEVCALSASEIKQDKQRADKFQTFMSPLGKKISNLHGSLLNIFLL